MKKNTAPYDHKKIEKKWQKVWAAKKTYQTREQKGGKKNKQYVLDMFPYPSGEGLHVGHPKGYIATDVYSRMQRMRGASVLHPMGWDAFGLPAEQYALKHKVQPAKAVAKNVAHFKKQLQLIGLDYDWSREINTTDPEFYKWTQWIFLQLFKKGLAYESYEPVNWCPSCKTGLANEDLEGDVCERCGTKVEQKPMRQWVLRITKCADRLLNDLELLPKWPDHIKESQRNWIGRSEGAEIDFAVAGTDKKITVFTTRPDTLFGATFMVLAPEHSLVQEMSAQITNSDEVAAYIEQTRAKTELMRQENKEKTGVELKGIKAINPANKEEIPVFIADYVLAGYGHGAVMAVPAHDSRDWEFARLFYPQGHGRNVIKPPSILGLGYGDLYPSIAYNADTPESEWKGKEYELILSGKRAYIGNGTITNSGQFDGLSAEEAKKKITEYAGGRMAVTYRLQDWVFSRQRYWGEPIPVVHCAACAGREVVSHAISINFRVQRVWDAITSGAKTIETRVLNPEEPERYFGDVNVGDTVRFVNVSNKQHLYATVKAVHTYRTIAELFADKHVYARVNSYKTPAKSVAELEKRYAETAPGYLEKAQNNGIVAWEFELVTKAVPVPEKELPVKLPNVKSYEPTGTGESPLAAIDKWVNVKCPVCKGKAKRETNTMPQWAGSSWYYLRYMDPKNKKALVDKKKEKYWAPVDMYVGGAEHATRHLIYARFWHKFLYDMKVVSTKEPFMELHSVGLVLAEDGRKMSKRWGNVINPDDVIATYGADTMRLYEMFMGPFENAIAWSTDSMVGTRRFLERVWKLQQKVEDKKQKTKTDKDSLHALHTTIKKVTEDIGNFKFNTAVSQMMILLNEWDKREQISRDEYETLLKLLAPFAPHVTEELWYELGNKKSIHIEGWPKFNPKMLVKETITLAVQVNGKMRTTVIVAADIDDATAKAEAQRAAEKWIGGQEIKRTIYVPGRLVNIVVG